jgi:hypothetical protein
MCPENLQVYADKCVVYKAYLNLCCGLPAKIIAHPWFTISFIYEMFMSFIYGQIYKKE